MSYLKEESSAIIHDVLIVGAGPCGLAVAARLCEHTPSAIFTDEEHQRYHWIRKHAAHTSIKNKKTGHVTQPTTSCCTYSTLVLDSSGHDWMAQWNRLFDTFEISHLRSPMFFHPDPQDRDGLLAYAHTQNRECELVEIHDCVGKEVSKHKKKKRANCRNEQARAQVTIDERDRKDYFTPSQTLFRDYCECVIDRYGLRRGLIRQEIVLDIEYRITQPGEDRQLFNVHTDRGQHFARTVVLAVGAGNTPAIPKPFMAEETHGACHAMQIRHFPDPSVKAKISSGKKTNVLVIGGGLTSAQVADMAIRHGVTKVWHFMRGPLKVKPFDVNLNWMGKFKNHEKSRFWSADSDAERIAHIKEARGGGSITPRFHKLLKRHIQSGRLSLHTRTTVVSQTYSAETKSWLLATSPPIELPEMDYIYFATGVQSDFSTFTPLQRMAYSHPIDIHEGLPALTDDLMWKDDVPLFVTGKLAALRLGPGAGNLEGARVGAERVAWGIENVLSRQRLDSLAEPLADYKDDNDLEYHYGAGIGSRYAALDTELLSD